MADLFELLREDHARIAHLLDEIRGDPAAEGPPPDVRRRRALELVTVESRHEAAEELVLWPTVRRVLPAGDELASWALGEEKTGRKLLNELDKTRAGTEEFDTLMHQVASHLRQHIMGEETQVFRRLRPALGGGEADRLGAAFERARRASPTRPHPMTPPDPRILAAVRPVMAAVERVRDAVAGRS